jgi:hypothetical protein
MNDGLKSVVPAEATAVGGRERATRGNIDVTLSVGGVAAEEDCVTA